MENKKITSSRKKMTAESFNDFDGLRIAAFSNNAYYSCLRNKKIRRIEIVLNTILIIAIIGVIALIINIPIF